jgi:hypothetical protein
MIDQHGTPLSRTWGIPIVAVLMIVFGAAEVVTGFTHHFVGIATSTSVVFTAAAVAIGLCYVVAGVLILTQRLWAARLAIVFLLADIVGRLALVVAGLYPLNSLEQGVGIIAGTTIAVAFATYIYLCTKRAVFE